MNSDVYNDAGQKIGKIGDLVISPSGEVSVAVIDVGGFIGLAKHRVAIPVKQFTQMHPNVVLPGANKEALKELPELVPVGYAPPRTAELPGLERKDVEILGMRLPPSQEAGPA